jgi:hypothetical protein
MSGAKRVTDGTNRRNDRRHPDADPFWTAAGSLSITARRIRAQLETNKPSY